MLLTTYLVRQICSDSIFFPSAYNSITSLGAALHPASTYQLLSTMPEAPLPSVFKIPDDGKYHDDLYDPTRRHIIIHPVNQPEALLKSR